ncbi:MAG: ligase-associated DNA damage response DEXH box helicase [Planctomycetota bacterium]
MKTDRGMSMLRGWFESRSWSPHAFQSEAWSAYAAGESGLVHVPTGAGKTYAAYGGPVAELLEESIDSNGEVSNLDGLRVLYITPLRAVSRDIALALQRPLADLGALGNGRRDSKAEPGLTVETRTGDTSSAVRARQAQRLPNVLVTTPESLCLLLTREKAAEQLGRVRCVIVDEWHELLSTKRGTQVELALARLRRLAPGVRTWALSATISNLDEAAQAAVGVNDEPTLVSAMIDRPVIIESVLPSADDPFPWAGHMGLVQLPRVLERIPVDAEGLPAVSTLLFVNTRSQAERWYSAIMSIKEAEWGGAAALHHGSLDRAERERVEAGLNDGSVRLAVATSSLDLGVDFAPVELVFQIGSPKGIARLMQRAGRASHRPGAPCTIICVPTHALEMVEVAAVRRSIAEGVIEPRSGERCPLDVLAQHMVTLGLGGGVSAGALFDEVRTAWSYRELTKQEFDWTLDLVTTGGETLKAYPEYKKLEPDESGSLRVKDKRIAQLHRMNVGTITGDAVMEIRYRNGRKLGFIEEDFIGRLRKGQTFVFAGKRLAYHSTRDLTAFVTPGRGTTNFTPIWAGTRLPISESLGSAVRSAISAVGENAFDIDAEPELASAKRLVDAQAARSAVPGAGETLIEIAETREGAHLFVYPFDGRLVHGGIAALVALRLTRLSPATFSTAVNDYGFELLTEAGYAFDTLFEDESGRELFSPDRLAEDAVESVNLSALAKGQFREIARVAGLVPQSMPGMPRSLRQVEARSGLIYDVFEQFDPENLLLHQARREVLEKHFERSRLARTLARLHTSPMVVRRTSGPTPLSLPLIIERLGARLTSEDLEARIDKMRAALEDDVRG